MSKKILIIEDDSDIAAIEKDYLEISGYEVEISETGADGMSQALSGDFDLIILDVMLPGMDGFEVCKSIRDKIDIPIMMLTARKSDIDKIKGLGFGEMIISRNLFRQVCSSLGLNPNSLNTNA